MYLSSTFNKEKGLLNQTQPKNKNIIVYIEVKLISINNLFCFVNNGYLMTKLN